jgi:hypothetical protein
MKRMLILVAVFALMAVPVMALAEEDVNSESMPAQAKTVEAPAEEAPAAEPAVEEPAAEEAVMEEPTAEEVVVEEPAAEEVVVEEPAAEEAVVEEPAAEEAVVEEPAAEEVVVEEPAAEGTAMEEPAAEGTAMEEPAAEEAAMEEPTAEEAVMEEPAAEGTAMEEPAADEAVMEEPAVEEVVTEEPVVEEAAAPEPKAPAGTKEAVIQNLQTINADIEAVFGFIGELYALRKPVEGGQAKLKETYLQFKNRVPQFKEGVEALSSDNYEMGLNMEQTFDKWQLALDGMGSEAVRAKGQERRDSKLATFNILSLDMENLQSDLASFISMLDDIESFLAFSLDAEGVSQIGDMLIDTTKIMDKLDIGIENVITKIASLPDIME